MDVGGLALHDALQRRQYRSGVGGRVTRIEIIGTKKRVSIVKFDPIRNILGVKSTFFVFETRKNSRGIIDDLIIKGAGWGHGVGLCQTGAYVMGKRGFRADQILFHYFQNSSLEKIY